VKPQRLPGSGDCPAAAVDRAEFPASLVGIGARIVPAPGLGDWTMSVQEGDTAPDFEMPATGGRTVSLSALKGKPFILYFYPKADTPGCTKEACAFQEALPQLGKIGLDVIGVSPDKIKPIEKFAEKYGLEFPLASDETKTVAEKYGTWVEKSMYGRKYMGMERSTFLVGSDGKVKKVWRKISVTGHAADVLKAAQTL